jgi:hypothetical protein
MSEYLDYVIVKIKPYNPILRDQLIDTLIEFKSSDQYKYIINRLRPIHYHFCRNLNIVFLDYSTYHRYKECGILIN